jgi:hypothetical protein
VAADASGNVYIADRSANHIVKVAASGAASLVSVTGFTLTNPQGVAVDGNGNLYIADSGHRRVIRLIAGTASVVQTPGQTIGSIMYGVAVDANGNTYAVDWSNNRVMKVDVSSAVLSFANTRIGATSSDSPKTATVTNIGNEALVAGANPIYTADFSEDSSDVNLCTVSTSLDPGEACDVSVMFTPQSAGSLSANVVITDNHLNGSSVTHNVAVSGTGLSAITPTITWIQPSAITYGTALSGVLNAVAKDGAATVSGTYVYSATPQGGSASTVTAATVLGVGNYTLSVSFTPDSISYTSATGSVSLTVNKAAPSITLESSANPELVSTSITLTATVTSSVSTPTGSVSFYDRTSLLGSGTLASGVATYTTSSLASATYSITAVYGGDASFSSVTSSTLSQVVSDLRLTVATGGSLTATVSAGGTATYHLRMAPSAGSVFPAAVALSASGGPTGSAITVTPSTIAAGAAATNVAVAVQVPATRAAVYRSTAWAVGLVLPLMGMVVLPFGIGSKRLSLKRVLLAALVLMVLISAGAVLGCGAAHVGTPPPQPTNYTVTVRAASGSLTRSTTLTLTVQ